MAGPPRAAPREHVLRTHGDARIDPWYWLSGFTGPPTPYTYVLLGIFAAAMAASAVLWVGRRRLFAGHRVRVRVAQRLGPWFFAASATGCFFVLMRVAESPILTTRVLWLACLLWLVGLTAYLARYLASEYSLEVADWQREWQSAPGSRRPLIRMRGLSAFAMAAIVSYPRVLATPLPPGITSRIIGRVATFVGVAALVLSTPLILDANAIGRKVPLLLFALIPSGVVLALPFSMLTAVDALRREAGVPPFLARAIALRLFPGSYPDAHELQGGEQKTHEWYIAFSRDSVTDEELAWCRAPLVARLDPAAYAAACAVPYLVAAADDSRPLYHALVTSGVDGADSFTSTDRNRSVTASSTRSASRVVTSFGPGWDSSTSGSRGGRFGAVWNTTPARSRCR